MGVSTTGGATAAHRAMSERQIDQEFARAAGALSNFKKRRVRLPLTHTGDDVVEVGYNGTMFLIRRGESVDLPQPLVEILEHAAIL